MNGYLRKSLWYMLVMVVFVQPLCADVPSSDQTSYTKPFPLLIERLSRSRINTYTSHYASQLSKARWFRRAVIGTGAALTAAAAGWAAKSYIDHRNTLPSATSQTTQTATSSSVAGSVGEKEKFDLNLKKFELMDRQLKRDEENDSWQGLARRGFIMGVVGGFSLGLYHLVMKGIKEGGSGLAQTFKDLWYRNEQLYYFWWKERLVEQTAVLKDLLASLATMSMEGQAEYGKKQSESSLFYSYCSEVINCHRMFIYSLERVLGVLCLHQETMMKLERERLVMMSNDFALELEKALRVDAQGNCVVVIEPQLIKSFQAMHDVMFMLLQAYQARLHEGA